MKKNSIYADTNLDEKMVLSRYLDLPKFVDLLSTSELHLASAIDFEDNLEGTLPELIRQGIIDFDISNNLLKGSTIQKLEYQNKLRTNLSCWTIGSKDNMALWKIYGGSHHSVAISTTLKNLLYSAPNWCNLGKITFKRVDYIDLNGKPPDGVYGINEHIFGIKYEAYTYEKEVRIVVTRKLQEHPSSLRLPIKLDNLLIKITVAPNAGERFYSLVKELTQKYKVSIPVEKSGLSFLINKAKK
jgi:hypothetical protein